MGPQATATVYFTDRTPLCRYLGFIMPFRLCARTFGRTLGPDFEVMRAEDRRPNSCLEEVPTSKGGSHQSPRTSNNLLLFIIPYSLYED